MNKDVITIEDCIDMFEMKNMSAIINDGHVIGFIDEEYKVIVKKRG